MKLGKCTHMISYKYKIKDKQNKQNQMIGDWMNCNKIKTEENIR